MLSGAPDGLILDFGGLTLGLWASVPLSAAPQGIRAEFTLRGGEEAWFVLGPGEDPRDWSLERARAALQAIGKIGIASSSIPGRGKSMSADR